MRGRGRQSHYWHVKTVIQPLILYNALDGPGVQGIDIPFPYPGFMATVAQLVEHSVVVRVVAGSSPVSRPILPLSSALSMKI